MAVGPGRGGTFVFRPPLSSVLCPLLRRGERKKTRSETSSQPANNFDYCSAEERGGGFSLRPLLAPWNSTLAGSGESERGYSTGREPSRPLRLVRLRESLAAASP